MGKHTGLSHLLESFRSFKEKNSSAEIHKNLEFNYTGHKISAEEMADALMFWAFVQSSDFCSCKKNVREGFFTRFFLHGNRLIEIIVRVELLPTRVWRKLLWTHNIDFMSFESFLRRITPEQEEALNANYMELVGEDKVPRVFGKLERFFGRLTAQKLLAEPRNNNLHYKSKGAWSYNLLGWGFGFNAYPKGVSDDTKVEEVSPLRFLSVKNHADDFVVDTESGKYWKLYRSARSNWGWNYDDDVHLKTHICPGFWWTLIVHTLFWVVSPVLLFTSPSWCNVNTINTFGQFVYRLPLILGASFTPGWIVKGALSAINRKLEKWARASVLGNNDKAEKALDFIKNTFLVILILLLGVMVVGIMGIFLRDLYRFLYLTFGHLGTCSILGVAAAYLGNKIYGKVANGFEPKFGKLFLPVRIACVAMASLLSLKFFSLYGAKLWEIASFFLSGLLEGLRALGWVFFLIVTPMIFAGVMAVCASNMQEKTWVKYSRVLAWVFNGLAYAILALAAALPFWVPAAFGMEAIGTGYKVCYMLFWAAMAVGYAFTWRRVIRLDPRYERYQAVRYHWLKPDPRCLMQSKWLSSLDPEQQSWACNDFVEVASIIYSQCDRDDATEAANRIAPKLDRRLLDFMEAHKGDLQAHAGYKRMNAEEVILAYAAGAATYDEALEKVKANHADHEAGKAKVFKALKVIFFPLYFLWVGLCWLWEKAVTLKRLYELFNERCPYIARSAPMRLEMDSDDERGNSMAPDYI